MLAKGIAPVAGLTTSVPAPEPVQGDEAWLPDTTASEVVTWSIRKWVNATPSFIAAVHRRDPAALHFVVRQLRHIVTRMDAYARTRIREWETKGKTHV